MVMGDDSALTHQHCQGSAQAVTAEVHPQGLDHCLAEGQRFSRREGGWGGGVGRGGRGGARAGCVGVCGCVGVRVCVGM